MHAEVEGGVGLQGVITTNDDEALHEVSYGVDDIGWFQIAWFPSVNVEDLAKHYARFG